MFPIAFFQSVEQFKDGITSGCLDCSSNQNGAEERLFGNLTAIGASRKRQTPGTIDRACSSSEEITMTRRRRCNPDLAADTANMRKFVNDPGTTDRLDTIPPSIMCSRYNTAEHADSQRRPGYRWRPGFLCFDVLPLLERASRMRPIL